MDEGHEDLNYESTSPDEILGMNIFRSSSPPFDVYAVGFPGDWYYHDESEREPALLDMFHYNIIGHDDQIAGRVMLFDVMERLAALPPHMREVWEPKIDCRYAVIIQTVPDNTWFQIMETYDLSEAQQAFSVWIDKFRPGAPIRVPIVGTPDERTIWQSDRPGIRTFHVIPKVGPYAHVTGVN